MRALKEHGGPLRKRNRSEVAYAIRGAVLLGKPSRSQRNRREDQRVLISFSRIALSSGFSRDMLGVARLGDHMMPTIFPKSIGSDCIDMNAFSINPKLVVADRNQASLILLAENRGLM